MDFDYYIFEKKAKSEIIILIILQWSNCYTSYLNTYSSVDETRVCKEIIGKILGSTGLMYRPPILKQNKNPKPTQHEIRHTRHWRSP